MTYISRFADQVPQRQHNEDRLRRAESWLTRSGEVKSEAEEFVLLWIAFNAAYGAELGSGAPMTRKEPASVNGSAGSSESWLIWTDKEY